MKSTFLRLLFLSVASAAFLRAMYSIHGIAPARLTTHRGSSSNEDPSIAIWGFSRCGPSVALNAATTEPRPDANQSATPEPPPVRTLAEGPPNIDDVPCIGDSSELSADAQIFKMPDLSSTTKAEDQAVLPFNHGGRWSLHDR